MSRRRSKKNRRPIVGATTAVSQDQPILQLAEQKVEEQLLPEVRESYLKIVVAGMKAGMANGPNSILAGLRTSKDPIEDCAKGAIGLIFILKQQAKGVMPEKAMVPAAITLMFKALSFAEQAGLVKIGTAELDRATQIFANTFLEKVGVTPPMIGHALKKVQSLSQDPVAMEQMKRKSGVTKHPDATEPTTGI